MRGSFVALILLGSLLVGTTAAVESDPGSASQREAGERLYQNYCTQCHGDQGDGKSAAALRLKPRPRDFTSGKYKIRSTPSGYMPRVQDIKTIIRDGMPYTSMPPWPRFTDEQLSELAYYLVTFTEKFKDPDYLSESMNLPEPPPFTTESALRGVRSM